MYAKEYLLQIRSLDARLKIIDNTIKKLRAEIESLDISVKSSWPDGQPHGTILTDPTGSKATQLADKVDIRREELRKKLLDYEYDQIKARSQLWSKQIEIIDTLSKVTDPTLYKILSYRYVDGQSFEWIAVEINYTWRHTINLHGRALEELQRILDSEK